ncbi:MAG: hypothetical protein IPM16_07110 [Chloroflexi bacterium]|nr:hypothetical protein [Chloroflexota bacterium]
MRRWLIAAIALCVIGPILAADFDSPIVSARFEASTYSPLTGEPFVLTLRVELTPDTSLVEWPQISDPWGPFEVRSFEPVEQDGNLVSQSFVVVLWRPEDAVTPPTFLGYGAGGGDIRRVPVTEAFFSVPTVLELGAEDPIPAVGFAGELWPWPALAILAGAGIVAVLYAAPQVRPATAVSAPPDPLDALARALSRVKTDDPRAASRAVMRAVQQACRLAPESDVLQRARETAEALLYRTAPVTAAEVDDLRRLAQRALSELRDG